MSLSGSLSRRTFLRTAGGTIAGLALPQIIRRAGASSLTLNLPPGTGQPSSQEWDFIQPRPARLDLWGRITHYGTPVRDAPGGSVISWLPQDTVLPLLEEIHAEGMNPYNTLWYRIDGGYLYTADVQPMKPYRMPTEITEITTEIEEEPGFWGEVIVPYTFARSQPGGSFAVTKVSGGEGEEEERTIRIILNYSSVYRVLEAEQDDAGFLWYKVKDDKKGEKPYYVLARHMRCIQPGDLSPIRPGADKRIVVTLSEQRIDCYENDELVFSTLTSSGGGGYATPKGDHAAVYKQPSRHMYSDPEEEAFSDPDFFDLPGVPFNIFFTTMGHAIHGTYWHGDYGRPRSHGCLNVTPEAARWLFRWTEPFSPYENFASGSSKEPGTPVAVV